MANKTIMLILCAGALHANTLYATETTPSLDFLEYLADVETSNDEWLDPLEMKTLANSKQQDEFEREQRDE